MINDGLKPLGLCSAEGNILLHLFAQDHGVRQEHIVEQLDVSKPAVSRALESLEAKGYVTRHKDASDRRASRVLLTPRAQEIRSYVESVYNHVYEVAAQGVSPDEVRFFIDLFSRVSDNFSRARS
ncbi:MAG: MarR family transcriptional regulator [Bacillota bacterium]